jgi:hypothetical protein
MSRWLALSVTLFVLTGTLGVAQKVVGSEEFDRAMKTIGTAIEGVNLAIGSKSYVDAKLPLALSRQVLASTRPVWETKRKPDAVRKTREAVARLDALDRALSVNAIDAKTVAEAVEDVTEACNACHAMYREGDEQTGYQIKAVFR